MASSELALPSQRKRGVLVGTQGVDVIIVGGGQAGLALSYWLTEQGREHLILEQGRIVESWRSKRWDSLRLIAPNWTLRLPGFTYAGDDPDGFMGKDEVVAQLETCARSFRAPVREGVRVTAAERSRADTGFTGDPGPEPGDAALPWGTPSPDDPGNDGRAPHGQSPQRPHPNLAAATSRLSALLSATIESEAA